MTSNIQHSAGLKAKRGELDSRALRTERLILSLMQNVSKPGHRRTDSTHSSNESEYTYNSEYAELEDGSRAAEVRTLACGVLSPSVGSGVRSRTSFHCNTSGVPTSLCPAGRDARNRHLFDTQAAETSHRTGAGKAIAAQRAGKQRRAVPAS